MGGMEWLEDEGIAGAVMTAVYYGCLDYKDTFVEAGLECAVHWGMSQRTRAEAVEEVFHEFLLHLEDRGVDFSTVDNPSAYLRRAFRNFAEDIRAEVENCKVSFGDLEGEGTEEGEDRCISADEVARAGRERALERFEEGRGGNDGQEEDWFRSLQQGTDRDQVLWLMENYPLIRYSDGLLNRLRELYPSEFGGAFPEESADALWDEARGEEYAIITQKLASIRAKLSDLRGERSAASRLLPEGVGALDAKIQRLLRRQAEAEHRISILVRFMPRQVHLLLPEIGRMSIGTLTVALFRARQALVEE